MAQVHLVDYVKIIHSGREIYNLASGSMNVTPCTLDRQSERPLAVESITYLGNVVGEVRDCGSDKLLLVVANGAQWINLLDA